MDYGALARQAVLDLLEREHAAIWLEVEAKLAERPHPQLPGGINPHHLTNARRELTQQQRIEQIAAVTRGGRSVAVLALRDRHGRQTAFRRAAARKRLLQARYLGWASTSTRGANLIADAGERVARASLTAAGGYSRERTDDGPATVVFGVPVPGGPLDDAAHIAVLDSRQRPVAVTVLVEVKNVRHWMYPSASEIFQLLDKAARLQTTYRDAHLLPVLVCRRAHFTTFQMAKDLGCLVFYTATQAILPRAEAPPDAVEEVRAELGYDLVRTEEAHAGLTQQFRETLPRNALRIAERWAQTAATLQPFYATLRRANLSVVARRQALQQLRTAAERLLGAPVHW